jgi:hypothetical protein
MIKPERLQWWQGKLSPLPVELPRGERPVQAPSAGAAADRLMTLLQSNDNLCRILKQAANYTPNAEQATGIAACLRQGQELLRISRTADLVVRPITAYYGMAALAKALALSFGNPRKLEAFAPSHGLRESSGSGVDLENTEVSTGSEDGLFQRFTASLCELDEVPVETRDGDLRIGLPPQQGQPPKDLCLTLKQLLQRITGIESLLVDTFSEPPLNVPVKLHLSHYGADQQQSPTWQAKANLALQLPRGADDAWAFRLHPRLALWRCADEERSTKVVPSRTLDLTNLPPDASKCPTTVPLQGPMLEPLEGKLVPFVRAAQGDWRLVAAAGGHSFPEPALVLATTFLLSIVARYRPDRWSAFAAFTPSGADSRLRALVEAFLDQATAMYPFQVMGALMRTRLVAFDGRPYAFA